MGASKTPVPTGQGLLRRPKLHGFYNSIYSLSILYQFHGWVTLEPGM